MAKKAAAKKTGARGPAIKTTKKAIVKKVSKSKKARLSRGWSETEHGKNVSRRNVARRRGRLAKELGPLAANLPARLLGG